MGADKRKKSNAKAEHPPPLLGGTAIKPPERHGWEAVRYVIYNPDTGEIFTRTPKSWFLITLFYCIYYSCLAAFWYGMLTLFLSFVSDSRPRYILEESIIGVNPGLGLKPGQSENSIDSSMFFLRRDAPYKDVAKGDKNGNENIDFAQRYQIFLQKNYPAADKRSDQIVDCGSGGKPEGNKSCVFDLAMLGPCQNAPYGYVLNDGASDKDSIEPCILLKPNRIFGWKPKTFSASAEDLDELETLNAPKSLVDKVKEKPGQLYVDCQGENPADRDALEGNMEYFPDTQAFEVDKYFPYEMAKSSDYQSPLVAVKFGKGLPTGQLIHIECKLWHKEAVHDRKDRMGLVHFEVIMENKEGFRKGLAE